jgi:hypothetical protein
MKMNEDVKQKWVAALISGGYEQGSGCLRDKDDKFCCLGVLCELHREENLGQAWIGCNNKGYMACYQFPPHKVSEWAGLKLDDEQSLARMNDEGASFEEIAKYIEEFL